MTLLMHPFLSGGYLFQNYAYLQVFSYLLSFLSLICFKIQLIAHILLGSTTANSKTTSSSSPSSEFSQMDEKQLKHDMRNSLTSLSHLYARNIVLSFFSHDISLSIQANEGSKIDIDVETALLLTGTLLFNF